LDRCQSTARSLDGDIRVEFGDDNFNPDDTSTRGAETNSTGLYTWHWDNTEVYATS